MISNSLLRKKILYHYFENVVKKHDTKTEKTKDNFEIQTGKKDANFGDSSGEYPFFTCALVPIRSKSYSYDGEYLILPGNGANVGETLYFSGKFEAYQRTYLISSKSGKIDVKYAYYYYLTYWKQYNQNKMYGSAIPYIRLGNLENFEILYPTEISTQKEIVSQIEELFKLIDIKENNDQKKDKLKRILKEKILSNAFCGALINNNNSLDSVDNEEFKGEKLFEIPSNWKWCEFKSIGESGIGLTYKPENISEDGMIVLRSSNIQNGKLDLKDIVRVNCKVNDNIIVKDNDILVCARNGSKRLVGKTCLLENMKEKMTYGAFMTIFRTQYYKYVYWFMQSKYYYNQLYENTNTMTINQVTQKKLNSLIIPLPPLEEQKKIVEKIESLFELIEQL